MGWLRLVVGVVFQVPQSPDPHTHSLTFFFLSFSSFSGSDRGIASWVWRDKDMVFLNEGIWVDEMLGLAMGHLLPGLPGTWRRAGWWWVEMGGRCGMVFNRAWT